MRRSNRRKKILKPPPSISDNTSGSLKPLKNSAYIQTVILEAPSTASLTFLTSVNPEPSPRTLAESRVP